MTFTSFKNARVVRSGWLEEGGRRLDCNPYMSGALEAREKVQRSTTRKDRLGDITTDIFHAGREGRTWVEDRDYGTPFLGSADILASDLSALPLISNKQVKNNPRFSLRKNWTLITRSGTIGRMAYVRPDMAGIACSEHILRVVPDEDRVPPGYLFAFLSSKYGVPLVVSGTYGAIIQHIEPHHISELLIPRFDPSVELAVHELIVQAAQLRSDAATRLIAAQNDLEKAIGQPPKIPSTASRKERLTRIIACSDIQRSMRMEGYFYNPLAASIEDWAKAKGDACVYLGDVAEVYDVPLFKHIYVDAEQGVPFFTSGDIFEIDRKARKFLSKTRTVNLHKYILQAGWILLARSGQLGGIIGRPQYSDSALSGSATSDHVLRVVPDGIPSGYLYAYLYSANIGYPLLTRTMTGHSIPALWPSQLSKIPVVVTDQAEMERISEMVVSAFEDRVMATELEAKARTLIDNALDKQGA